MACESELGWCPGCRALAAIDPVGDGLYRCGNNACGAMLRKCHNYEDHGVCNRCFSADEVTPERLCDYCRFNATIPDLSVPGNRKLWHRLELAKRRLLYTLDLLGLPYGKAADGIEPELSFDFKGDADRKNNRWWALGREERVHTGHLGGKITINIREADHVERERARVTFEEAQRTVIGHFRHEIGHYYWEMLVKGRCEADFNAHFGDHRVPYDTALQEHYHYGPPADWRDNFVSAYASMHPWEDFAESFGVYLDMVSLLDTSMHGGLVASVDPRRADWNIMVDRYVRLAVMLNELNRAMGLIDLVPEVLTTPTIRKLAFVHNLIRVTTSRRQSLTCA
jgi:hypothetical protein